MKTLNLQLPYLHPAQKLVFDDPHRFRVVMASRRFGKNILAAVEETRALMRGGNIWHIAPSYSDALSHWRLIQRLLERIPSYVAKQDTLTITIEDINHNGYYQIKSAVGGLRGEGLDFIGVDECSFIQGFEEMWQGDLRPTLSTTQGKVLFISSAMSYDYFFDLFSLGQKNDPEWKSWKFTAYDSPYIPLEEIESAKRSMSAQRFAREYMSEPTAFGTTFHLDSENKKAQKQERAAENHEYVIGCDIGGAIDNTAYAVVDITTQELVFLDAFLNPSYVAQIVRLKELCDRFHPKVVMIEKNNAGESFIQNSREFGIQHIRSITTTNATKAEQVESLVLDFEQHRFKILNDEDLIREMLAFESSRLPSGLIKYSASKGHDDMVLALLIAHEAANTGQSMSGIQIPVTGLWGEPKKEDIRRDTTSNSRGALWSYRDNEDDRRGNGLWRERRR